MDAAPGVPAPATAPGRPARSHVPALDGLRGIAVLAVLAYHLGGAPLPGGFLGVSTFFTLSGFLITSLLLTERRRTDRIALRRFWGRRFRRLLPASLVCLGLIVVLSRLGGFSPDQVDQVRSGLPWVLGYLANWHQLVAGGGYLANFATPSPLRHFWSLAIEEQFYLVFPLLVALLLATGRHRLRVLGGALAGVLAVSVALPFAVTMAHERVYLGTDTRLAELVLGALLAVALRGGLDGPRHAAARRGVAVAGFAVLALQAVVWAVLDESTSGLYHGGFALYAVGSVVVIAGALVPGPLSGLLAVGPLVAVGQISYGLYLFHWPVILWLTPERVGIDGVGLAAVQVAVSIALATVSYVVIERPIRYGTVRLPALAPAAAAAIALLLVGSITLPRTAPIDIAGAGPGGAVVPDEPPPTPTTAAPTRVSLVVDRDSTGLVDALRAQADREATWEVASVLRLDCASEPDRPCPWEATWPQQLVGTDKAVILTDTWDYRPYVTSLASGVDPASADAVPLAVQRFVQGIDLLSGGGTREVLWVSWPVDTRDGREPLATWSWSVARQTTMERPSLAVAQVPDGSVSEVAAPIEVRVGGARSATKVMVVGDSVGSSAANGLARWGTEHGAVVWDNARGGCGVVRDGRRLALDGQLATEGQCRPWRDDWGAAARRWEADVAVVLVGVWDLSDRELPGGDTVLQPGDPAWDRYVVDEYVAAVDELTAAGTRVLLMTPPCVGYEGARVPGGLGTGNPVFAQERQRYARDHIIPSVVQQRPGTGVYDLFGELCPTGTFEEQLTDQGEPARPDGLHFGAAGALWWAERSGTQVLAAVPGGSRPGELAGT